jgi:hypothetical protein
MRRPAPPVSAFKIHNLIQTGRACPHRRQEAAADGRRGVDETPGESGTTKSFGAIDVESRLDQGTAFTIWLPRQAAPESAPAAAAGDAQVA